jgi:hypothetical protein
MIKDLLESNFKKKGYPVIIVFFCILTSLVLFLCNADSSDSNTENDQEITVDSTFNETALFLAGKDIPKSSSLYEYSKTKEYKSYSKQLETNWDKIQRMNEKKISIWREKQLPETYTSTVFYPFSGPDILNAVIFFPDGNEYIMFGLEAPGEIPRPQNISYDKLQFGLKKLWEALDTVISVNFFKTKEMINEISTNAFDSVNSVMMFFLARTNYNIVNVKKIWIDDKGIVTTEKPKGKSNTVIPGSEIVFKKANKASIKRVLYFQIDISDNSFKKHTNFASYLKGKGRFTTIIKSASYLMHRDKEFSVIRDHILSQSDYLLQDDSGIPLKCFSPKEWKLVFHGNYTKPIELFASRYQEDLFQAMKKNSTGPLDFSYGYNFKEHNPNLLFGERIK